VVTLIAGRELEQELTQKEGEGKASGGSAALEVRGLSSGNHFRDVSFTLHKGEILGVYGLQGSGRTELLETIFGLRKPDFGEVILSGEKIQIKNSKDAIRSGFALIAEDRRRTGLFTNMDVKDNVSVVLSREITLLSFLRKSSMFRLAEKFVKRLDVKVTGLTQMVAKLSGGNQQKVIISRWLSKDPEIFLMDEPTRGIDVGAKAEIFKILRRLRDEEGKSIVMVSSELPEVVAECDRVIVMRNGRVAGEVKGRDITKENILQFAFSG
jgi:ABC-type sugar transport system ATPase subunit